MSLYTERVRVASAVTGPPTQRKELSLNDLRTSVIRIMTLLNIMTVSCVCAQCLWNLHLRIFLKALWKSLLK